MQQPLSPEPGGGRYAGPKSITGLSANINRPDRFQLIIGKLPAAELQDKSATFSFKIEGSFFINNLETSFPSTQVTKGELANRRSLPAKVDEFEPSPS